MVSAMSPPAPTERGEATRRRIIETASRLFTERGFEATSISSIIDAAQVTKGGFYFHFASKTSLGLEVLDAMRTEQRATVVEAVGVLPRAVDQLVAMAATVADTPELATGATMGRLCMELKADPSAPALDTAYEEWFDLVGDLVARAQAEGDADPSIDPREAGFLIVSTFIGVDYVEQVRGNQDGVRAHLESYVRFALRGAGLTHPDDRPPTATVPSRSTKDHAA